MGTATEVRIDPEIRDLIPPMTDAERSQLKALLNERGCDEPLTVWAEEGILLDGHNRHEICEELRIPFDTRELSFASREAALEWVCTYQLGRRNLPAQVRGELVLKKDNAVRAAAAARMRAGNPVPNSARGRTDEELAEEAGVGKGTIQAARTVRDEAAPELREAARSGDVSVSAAAEITVLPKPEQAALAKQGKRAVAQAAKKVRAEKKAARRAQPTPPDPDVSKAAVQTQRHYEAITAAVNDLSKLLSKSGVIGMGGAVDRDRAKELARKGGMGKRPAGWAPTACLVGEAVAALGRATVEVNS